MLSYSPIVNIKDIFHIMGVYLLGFVYVNDLLIFPHTLDV